LQGDSHATTNKLAKSLKLVIQQSLQHHVVKQAPLRVTDLPTWFHQVYTDVLAWI
jgi:hypothetical protein